MEEFDTFDTFDKEQVNVSDTEVRLQEVDVTESINEKISDKVEYPCVIVKGIQTTEEVHFFMKRECNESRALPFYLDFNGLLKRLGFFDMTLDNLLIVRCIGEYDIRIHKNSKDYLKINLHDPEQLIKFIEL